jgi:flagellar hook-associated protein 1 FlgK
MSSIFAGLHIGERALQAQQFALETTQRNITNANTPYYSRQRVNFVPGDPIGFGAVSPGGGVISVSADAFRDRFIDYRVTQELQPKGENDAVLSALNQVDSLLNEGNGQGLQAAISDFFAGFSSLANAPEDQSLRRQVLVNAQNMAREFARVYGGLQDIQASSDRAVADTVAEVNSTTEAIAELNSRIAQAHGLNSSEEYALRDQRQQMLDKLAGLIDVSYWETESGAVTLTTADGTALVVENNSYKMDAVTQPGTTYLQVMVGGQSITSDISSGKLGGLLKLRDSMIPDYLGRLDDMAASLIDTVNAQHALGADLSGQQGGDFFAPFTPLTPGSNTGAARSISVAIADPSKIAAAGLTEGPGSNANARLLAGIGDDKILGGGTATLAQYYSDLVFTIGAQARTAQNASETQGSILLQLQNQRDSLSGVNLDEEAVNVIKYQKAYEASARYISVLDGLTEDLMNILG